VKLISPTACFALVDRLFDLNTFCSRLREAAFHTDVQPKPTSNPPKRSNHVRRPSRTVIVSLIAALALAVPATAGARALLLSGSTSIFPLMTQLAAAYHKATHQPTPKVGQASCSRRSPAMASA
jgi:hypothetical protein